MFPMVTVPREFFAAKDLLMKEVEWTYEATGKRPSRIEVGVMLETPALAFSLKELAGEAEFLSVGTNDLMQFFYAADRMTPSVSDRYDLVSPSALRFLNMVSEECRTHGIGMSACGEATGSSLSALCFVALGFTNLSMSAGSIGPVKRMIRSLDLPAFRADFIDALDKPNDAFRNQLLALAAEHGVELAEG
jgi:phosphotransferase system enzyme I (PtsP)